MTPGPIVPARELLGEMLLDLTQPAQYRRDCLARADRIEAALATLRASQEQDGEVRLADGCCSASSPCAHQKQDPSTICGACQRAEADRDLDEDLMPGGFN